MPIITDKIIAFKPGSQVFVDSIGPNGVHCVVFEDDGDTGYFYACQFSDSDKKQKILDAVHIYNVKDVVDKDIESECKIGWSPDGHTAILMINQYPHAVADFKLMRLFSRTNFPKTNCNWSKQGHQWEDDAMTPFK